MQQVFTFTVRYPGIQLVLGTECWCSPAFDPALIAPPLHPEYKKYVAIWDTGATGSVVTQEVVDACGLKPTGIKKVYHAQGEEMVETYLVNIRVPNQVSFKNVEVIKGKLTGATMLIGMDIIATGDFSVTNVNGKTVFSFRWPSQVEIDFNTQLAPQHTKKQPHPSGMPPGQFGARRKRGK